jgi:gamma-glutamyltranspeptidase/glutathione hydrolase
VNEARRFPHAAIATPHYLASSAGAEVLARGGNAVDAILAANLALGVVAPYMCGYGGDLFAIVWDGSLHGYRSAGRSAAGATIESVRDAAGLAEMPFFGPHAVTVPGAVRGWFTLIDRWASMPFSELASTALDYAEQGFPLTGVGAGAFSLIRRLHRNDSWSQDLVAVYAKERTLAGARLSQPALARTIRLLGEDGADAYYRGPIAAAIADTVQGYGGTLTTGDFAAHEDAWVEPLSATLGDTSVVELPPPTQGVGALEALLIADGFDLPDDPESVERHHLLVEAVKIALCDRDDHVSDPAAMDIEPERLLHEDWISARRAEIDPSRASRPVPRPAAQGGTAYLCAADADGLAVSLIQSNFSSIGAGVHVPDWGINLQNRGSSFTLDPHHVNALAPGKLPMHTLIPAMALRDGRPCLVFGTMGAHGQLQTHLQVLTRLFVDGAELQAAIAAPRWVVDPGSWRVDVESRFGEAWCDGMSALGHTVAPRGPYDYGMGHAHAIAVEPGGLAVATDPRAEGAALGR